MSERVRRDRFGQEPAQPFRDRGIVEQDWDPVAGKVYIGFDGADARVKCHFECRKSVFRFKSTGAAMTLPLGVSCRVIADARPRIVIEEAAVE